jgi:hypothetical protein
MKLKRFCTTKEIEEAAHEWDKIFISYTSNNRLITRIYRVLKKLNSHKISNTVKKWAKNSTELKSTRRNVYHH